MLNLNRLNKYSIPSVRLLTATLLFVLTWAPLDISAMEPNQQNVLFISSSHQDMPWHKEIKAGFDKTARVSGGFSSIYYEYLDSGRFKSSDHLSHFNSYLQTKYTQRDISVVIYESAAAAGFYLAFPGTFETVRKIFINPGRNEDKLRLGLPPDEGGQASIMVPVNINFDEVIAELFKHRKAKSIYLIAGATPAGRGRVMSATESVRKLYPDTRIHTLTGMPMKQLLESVSTVDQDALLLYLLVLKDGEGTNYIPYIAARRISERASAPLYTIWTSLLGSGVLGGFMLNGELVGEAVANLIVKPPSETQATLSDSAKQFFRHYYDWRQLKKWDISVSDLPEGSVVLYEERSFVDRYFIVIVIAVVVIVLCAVIIIMVSRIQVARKAIALRKEIVGRQSSEQERERMVEILDSSSDFVAIADMNQTVVYTNAAFRNAIGIADRPLSEQPSIQSAHPAWAGDIVLSKAIPTAMEKGIWSGETAILTSDGSEIPVSQLIIAHHDQAGNPTHISTVIRDIQDLKNSQLSLERYTEELKRSNQELEEFAYIASHDLQEPLRKIQAFGSLLSEEAGEGLSESAAEYLNIIISASNRMQTFITDLLSYSRVTTQKKAFEHLDLKALIDDVVEDFELDIDKSKGKVFVGDCPDLEGDRVQLRQLFQNLIGNAFKYRHSDRPVNIDITAEILPGTDHHPRQCKIDVKDNGIGFEAQYSETIFGIFQRLHTRQEYDGTGVGLAICRKIVERHSGTISATGVPDKGSTFTVTLPLIQEDSKTTIQG